MIPSASPASAWSGVGEPQRPPARRSPTLSSRQREVLRLVAQGLSNQEIAAELTITINTVKFHVRTIFQALGVRNRVEAAQRWAAADAAGTHVI